MSSSVTPKKLILFVLVLLPSFFFAWYMNSPFLAKLTAWPLDALLPQVLPDAVSRVGPTGRHLGMLSPIPPATPQPSARGGGQIVFVNLLIYSFSIPLFAALAIASEASAWAHVRRVSLGVVLLYLFLVASAAIRILYLLEYGARFAHVSPVTDQEFLRHLIRHGHYLTVTILPTALPILFWAMLYPKSFASLVPFGKPAKTADDDSGPAPSDGGPQ